jgi:hypothetical protein
MRTIEVVVPSYFLLSSTAIWLYLLIISGLGIGGLWWYQEQLRRKQKINEG